MELAELGMRKTRASSEEEEATKRRTVNNLEFSSSLLQLKRCRRVEVASEISASFATSENSRGETNSDVLCATSSSDHTISSCISSNGSSALENNRMPTNLVDLEESNAEIETSTYDFHCGEKESWRDMEPGKDLPAEESGEKQLTEKENSEASTNNSRSESSTVQMITYSELEEFFAKEEKEMQKRFIEKYNFDMVNDVPLEGRYEWIKLK